MENSKFNLIRNYINSRGIGDYVTYKELIKLTSRMNGTYNPNCYTVYSYCRALRKLGYLVRINKYTLRIYKLIPTDISCTKLREEYSKAVRLSNNKEERI